MASNDEVFTVVYDDNSEQQVPYDNEIPRRGDVVITEKGMMRVVDVMWDLRDPSHVNCFVHVSVARERL